MLKYNIYLVKYEHTTADSDTKRQSSAVVTIYGESEFRMLEELKKERPGYRDIVILESVKRA